MRTRFPSTILPLSILRNGPAGHPDKVTKPSLYLVRLSDEVIKQLLPLIYRCLRSARPKWIPKFSRKSAMDIDTVFR
jgi:hypothetical protein